jgi:hypothetical protein
MNKYEKIISSVKGQTGFLKLIEQGVNPEEIKDGIGVSPKCHYKPWFCPNSTST